jgi:hypothetical protein
MIGLEQLIRVKMMGKGISAGDAYKLAKEPWVQQMAQDYMDGKPLPAGMSELGPKDLEKFKADAAKANVPFTQYLRSEFAGVPFKGEAAYHAGGGSQAVGREAAGLLGNPSAPAVAAPAPASSGPLEMLQNKVMANEIGARPSAVPYESTQHSWMVDAPGRAPNDKFERVTASWVPRLMADLQIPEYQARGIMGGIAPETSGFVNLKEKASRWNPNAEDPGKGGRGLMQWTNTEGRGRGRRADFEKHSASLGLDINDPEASYQNLIRELNGSESRALERLKKTTNAEDAAVTFERAYLRPGAKHEKASANYAKTASGLVPSLDRKPEITTSLPEGGSGIETSIPQSSFGGSGDVTPQGVTRMTADNTSTPVGVSARVGTPRGGPSASGAAVIDTPPPSSPPPLPARNPNVPTFGASPGRTGVGGPTVQRIAEAYAASAGRTGVGGNTRPAAPPPLPTPNPLGPGRGAPPLPMPNPRRGGIDATAQVGAMNGGLPPAPAYGNAQISPQLPTQTPFGSRIAERVAPPTVAVTGSADNGVGSQRYGYDPVARGSANVASPNFRSPGPGGAMGSMPGLVLSPPDLNQSSHPKNVFLGGSSSHPKNVFPPAPPSHIPVLSGTPGVSSHPKNVMPGSQFTPGIRPMTGATGVPATPLPGGLGMNPFTAANLSQNQRPTTLQATVQALTPPMPMRKPAPMPMAAPPIAAPRAAPPAAARARPGAAMPTAPLAPAPKQEGMGVLGPSFGGGHSPATSPTRSAFSGMTPSQAQGDIASAHMRAAAALHQSAQRVQQGFLVNRATMNANLERRRMPLGSTRGQQSYIRSPINTGYGYL